MNTFLAGLVLLFAFNLAIFMAIKVFNFLEPFLLKLFFRKHDFSALINDPELKEKGLVRNKFLHWFLSAFFVLFFATSSLGSVNFYLALLGGLVLYFVGSSEAQAIADISAKYREKEYAENTELTEKFLEKVLGKMQSLQVDKKDVERN